MGPMGWGDRLDAIRCAFEQRARGTTNFRTPPLAYAIRGQTYVFGVQLEEAGTIVFREPTALAAERRILPAVYAGRYVTADQLAFPDEPPEATPTDPTSFDTVVLRGRVIPTGWAIGLGPTVAQRIAVLPVSAVAALPPAELLDFRTVKAMFVPQPASSREQ